STLPSKTSLGCSHGRHNKHWCVSPFHHVVINSTLKSCVHKRSLIWVCSPF
ncbi:unnamed protein product, partial [Brassica rapa subsp. trilocularis]